MSKRCWYKDWNIRNAIEDIDNRLTALERGGEKLEYGKGSTVSADDVRGILASKPATATVVHDLIVKYRKQFQETVADDGDLDDLLTAFSIELREAWGIK